MDYRPPAPSAVSGCCIPPAIAQSRSGPPATSTVTTSTNGLRSSFFFHSAALFHVASAVFFPRVPKNSLAKAAAPSSWMNDVGSIDRCRTLTGLLTCQYRLSAARIETASSTLNFSDNTRSIADTCSSSFRASQHAQRATGPPPLSARAEVNVAAGRRASRAERRCEHYRPMSCSRLRMAPWIRLSILPSTRSHRSPAVRFRSASAWIIE